MDVPKPATQTYLEESGLESPERLGVEEVEVEEVEAMVVEKIVNMLNAVHDGTYNMLG